MWIEIGYLEILLWMTLIGSAYWLFRSIVFAKKPKRKTAETNLDNKRDVQFNLLASEANPAKKATVRIGVPPKHSTNQTVRIFLPSRQGPDPLTPSSKQTIRISMPPKQGQASGGSIRNPHKANCPNPIHSR